MLLGFSVDALKKSTDLSIFCLTILLVFSNAEGSLLHEIKNKVKNRIYNILLRFIDENKFNRKTPPVKTLSALAGGVKMRKSKKNYLVTNNLPVLEVFLLLIV